MKLIAALLLSLPLFGQAQDLPRPTHVTPSWIAAYPVNSPQSFVSGGVFYNSYSHPNVGGFAAYGQMISRNLYSYTSVDIYSLRPNEYRPQTSVTTGVASFVRNVAGADVFALAGIGVAVASNDDHSGANVGTSYTGGAMGVYPIGKHASLIIPLRVVHTTIGGTQYIAGLGFGWGR